MNRKYNLKLDLQFRCNNSTMKFNQFDNNTSDFFMRITNGGNLVDIEKAIVVLAIIKPSGKIASQFVEVKNGLVYVDLKPSMKDEIGTYTAQAMLILEDERVVTNVISYEVEEDKIFSLLNDTVGTSEEFTLLTDMLSRLSAIEISEEQRVINEAERILSEENRKIEEAKRVEAELIRQHEEADRSKYDATRESNENIRKQNESIRLANEANRIDEEAKRVEEEANRVEAEQLRKDNYNFMTEDEERRRSEANAHKEAEKLRAQAETNRVNEEAKRRTTEQARVLAENTRVSNENTRKANEITRQNNETKRVEAETQRQNRYNSFIADAEANASNFENYTNSAKIKEEERKSNELNRKSQEDRRVSNEVERISNENTRKANEVAREKNETSRQYVFENKVDEVDKKIIEINTTKDNFISSINTKVDTKISELNTTKDNFVSSVNTKVDTKISELDNAKSDMTNTVSNKIDEVENRFNALTSKQQQDAEVIDARDGETSLKARLDRDIEKAKQVYVNVEGSNISTDSSSGYLKDVEILGNTIQDASNLADIRSVGDKVEGQELYEIPVLSCAKNLANPNNFEPSSYITSDGLGNYTIVKAGTGLFVPLLNNLNLKGNTYIIKVETLNGVYTGGNILFYGLDGIKFTEYNTNGLNSTMTITTTTGLNAIMLYGVNGDATFRIQISKSNITEYEPYIEDKLTILSPVQLEMGDRIYYDDIEKIWCVEKYRFKLSHKVLQIPISGNNSDDMSTYMVRFKFKDHGFDDTPFMTKKTNTNNLLPTIYSGIWSNDMEGVCVTDANYLDIRINKNKLHSITPQGALQYLQDNDFYTLLYLDVPKKIKLPHDQQVKLRTFASKTNISFLTEIEGTIKAQVPKSLGATVNTHTEQINNLNKELDRVKKLEESTVSTVTTESDFTTVEATSNGYFEDVKLEGKTLVNLAETSTITLSNTSSTSRVQSIPCVRKLEKGKVYTLFAKCTDYSLNGVNGVKFGNWGLSGGTVNDASICKGVGGVVYKFTIKENATTTLVQIFIDVDNTEGVATLTDFIILEGDHTQNPPNGYIEGLKSVGQSATTSEDGVDEIVVSSTIKNIYECTSISVSDDSIVRNIVPIQRNFTVVNNSDKGTVNILIRDIGGSWKRDAYSYPNTTTKITINEGEEVYRITCFYRNGWSSNDVDKTENLIRVYEEDNVIEDKKRLLYYNEETQAWEKPILRQWDSIEKHANGKYYYHQRSGEVVLNGSEEWASWLLLENTIGFLLTNTSFKNTTDKYAITAISDKLTSRSINDFKSDVEGIGLWDDRNRLVTRVNNSKLSTQDVQGFKQWLQTNNVTVVYQLAEEKVYECTNIDLITYVNETNYVIESGVLSPKTTLKVHSNISNVVSLLQKKVSLLESNMTKYMITQNRLMLASRYNADTVSFKVDVASFSDTFEYDNDLYELILNNILVGKDNYNREYIENLTRFYWMDFVISDEMYSTLFEIIEEQHNPKIEEETPFM